MYDSIIRGGTVIDGTGAERRRTDVAVKDGRIAGFGTFSASDADTVIDAGGRIVTPGFIDVHTHYDAQLFWDSMASPSPFHGVTTILGGFCGFGLAPLNPDATDYLVRMLSRVEDIPLQSLQAGVPCDWSDFAGFSSGLEGQISVNAGFSVGHSTVRRVVMGERAIGDKATPAEIAAMQDLVRKAMAQGALGFSTSHSTSHSDHDGMPVPSRFAAMDEFIALSRVCREFEGSSIEIQPGLEYDDVAYELVTEMSLAAQRTLNWNLIAVADMSDKTFATIERQLAMTDYARSRGAEVIALTLPTGIGVHIDMARGGIFDLVPGWEELFKVSPVARKAMLADPAYRQTLYELAQSPSSPVPWLIYPDEMLIEQGRTPGTERFNGMTIGEAGRATGKTPFDAMLDVVIEDNLQTLFTRRDNGESREAYEYRAKLWQDDRVLIGASDAGAHVETIDSFAIHSQMLGQAVRNYGVVSMEQAIQYITQAPAQLMGLRGRGELREGFCADMVILDENEIGRGPVHMRNDFPAGASRLYAESTGIDRVIVNGTVIVHQGQATGATPGKLLRRQEDTFTVGLKVPEAA